ncbi:MAG: hypothetical protein ABIW76_06795, partial [Fibrobacteria bacterium]
SLFGCNQPDKIAALEGNRNVTGRGNAHVRLPSIPADYLAKAAGSQATALFALTISGEGMAPIYQSWVLTPGQPQSAYISDIPVGMRVFSGRLIRLDTAIGDTSITHEGSDTVWIERDSITEVNLFLLKAGGGTAHVCVEVEGWPRDLSCYKPPIPVPRYPWFGGCWKLSVTKKGMTSKQDSVFNATLSIQQWDSAVSAVLTWNSGARDSAWGSIYGPTLLLGNGNGQFTLKANLDSAVVDTTNPIELRGNFVSLKRNITGQATGWHMQCDTLIQPPMDSIVVPPIDTLVVPGVDSNAACWYVWQTLSSGGEYKGLLFVIRTDSGSRGTLQWNGFPAIRVTNGNAPALGSTLYLFGDLPSGMSESPVGQVHHAHYKAKVNPFYELESGVVYSTWLPREFTASDLIGSWGGRPIPCK